MKSYLDSTLLKKSNYIHKLSYKDKVKFLKPLFEDNKNRVSYRIFSKEELNDKEYNNKYFFNKLNIKNNYPNLKKWERDFQQSRQYKKNICSLPCVDFHKTMQINIDKEKNENKKRYINITLNLDNNKFNKIKFNKVEFHYSKERKIKEEEKEEEKELKREEDEMITEHFSNGETVEKDENKDIELIFIYGKNEDEIKVKCKTKEFFYEAVDKFCIENNIDKKKIEEFEKKDKQDKEKYIDLFDSIENNKLNENEKIIVVMKK